METELMDSAAVAKMLGMNPNWPAVARMTGNGPRYLRIGRLVRYRREDVEEWLASKERTSTSSSDASA
jgi:predicted DNA-binding transcriptional regulator AlpA